eukprot:m.173676 g.173676  ORF g.173676 m.173676 type:complete len:412 (+) comp18308_c0_seq1:459-1694(+)
MDTVVTSEGVTSEQLPLPQLAQERKPPTANHVVHNEYCLEVFKSEMGGARQIHIDHYSESKMKKSACIRWLVWFFTPYQLQHPREEHDHVFLAKITSVALEYFKVFEKFLSNFCPQNNGSKRRSSFRKSEIYNDMKHITSKFRASKQPGVLLLHDCSSKDPDEKATPTWTMWFCFLASIRNFAAHSIDAKVMDGFKEPERECISDYLRECTDSENRDTVKFGGDMLHLLKCMEAAVDATKQSKGCADNIKLNQHCPDHSESGATDVCEDQLSYAFRVWFARIVEILASTLYNKVCTHVSRDFEVTCNKETGIYELEFDHKKYPVKVCKICGYGRPDSHHAEIRGCLPGFTDKYNCADQQPKFTCRRCKNRIRKQSQERRFRWKLTPAVLVITLGVLAAVILWSCVNDWAVY